MEDNTIYSVLTGKLSCGQCSWIYDSMVTQTWYNNGDGCNGTDPNCTCGPMPSYNGDYYGQQVLVDCTPN